MVLLSSLDKKKAVLDGHRPLPPALVKNLEEWFAVELTYTSNAIEGNTLTRRETALVIEKGITVRGKSLREHLEAVNHDKALRRVEELVRARKDPWDESSILDLHRLILAGISDADAGRYRTVRVRIAGAEVVLPNPVKVPALMKSFIAGLKKDDAHPVLRAAQAHLDLVTIHPFTDGNGRTARLLMNLILLRAGWPPAFIRREERLDYLAALEKAQTGGGSDDYNRLILKAVDRSLDITLDALGKGRQPAPRSTEKKLLKIGELARLTETPVSTLRFWTREGLLSESDRTPGGYVLYAPDAVERVARVKTLQTEERLSIPEIRSRLNT